MRPHVGVRQVRHVAGDFRFFPAVSEVCLAFFIASRFPSEPAALTARRDRAEPRATRGRGLEAYSTASRESLREECRGDRALSPVHPRVRPNFHTLFPSAAGIRTRACFSQHRALEAIPHPSAARAHRLAGDTSVASGFVSIVPTLTILSSPRAAPPQTRASRHARNRNPPRTTTPF